MQEKDIHTWVANVFCGYLSNAVLTATLTSESGILVHRDLTSREASIASLGIFRSFNWSFILLMKSFASFTNDGIFLQSAADGSPYIVKCSMYGSLLSW